jgi:hypothetical protein
VLRRSIGKYHQRGTILGLGHLPNQVVTDDGLAEIHDLRRCQGRNVQHKSAPPVNPAFVDDSGKQANDVPGDVAQVCIRSEVAGMLRTHEHDRYVSRPGVRA